MVNENNFIVRTETWNQKHKPLKEMNLIDDFLFDVATEKLENCKTIIELSTGLKLKSLRWKEGQKVVHNLPGRRGIRMDFTAEDDSGRVFDVEMQNRNEGNIPKRTRFYQSLLDAPMLKSGEQGFDNLKPLYIIILCNFAPYCDKLYRYTFENRCEENLELKLGDGVTKLLLSTKGENDGEVPKELVDFLHYVANSEESSIPEKCDERLICLHKNVQEIKSSAQVEVELMKMEERDRMIRVEGERMGEKTGRVTHLVSQICKKLSKNQSEEEIADLLEEDINIVHAICEIARESAPNYNVEEIARRYLT